jgi:hypothetical protein
MSVHHVLQEAKGVRGLQAEAVVDRQDGGSWNRTGRGQKPEGSHWLSTKGCHISADTWQCLIRVSKVMS